MSGHNALQDLFEGPAETPDPGDGNAIVATKLIETIGLVTTTAETRSLPDPDRAGIHLYLVFVTDGGDCVITADSAVNTSGNTIMTFDAAREGVGLISIPTSSTAYAWEIVTNNGSVGLS